MPLPTYADHSHPPRLLNLLATVHHRLGEVKARHLQRPEADLERAYRVSAVHGTLAMEGNVLDPLPVAELVDQPRAAESGPEELEVINTHRVYDLLPGLEPASPPDLRRAHGVLMHGLSLYAGSYRDGPIDVLYGDPRPLRTAPADHLPAQVEELLHHAATDEGPPLLTSCVLHFGLVYLRPFTAGNGRMARLWQRRLLMDHWPVFGFLPMEAFVHRTEPAYHAALEYADRTGDCTGFLTYMLERIDEALAELLAKPDPVLSPAQRVDRFLQQAPPRSFRRKDYLIFFPGLSIATATRDLAEAVRTGVLERHGEKRRSSYTRP